MELELHAFGDASTQGVGAAVYSVIRQPSGATQRLVAAKARLAKQGLTIPRLELVSAHSATILVTNVAHALQGLFEPRIHGWLDSTVALHWKRTIQSVRRKPRVEDSGTFGDTVAACSNP